MRLKTFFTIYLWSIKFSWLFFYFHKYLKQLLRNGLYMFWNHSCCRKPFIPYFVLRVCTCPYSSEYIHDYNFCHQSSVILVWMANGLFALRNTLLMDGERWKNVQWYKNICLYATNNNWWNKAFTPSQLQL